jgi:choloylglycine hydrolase
MIGGSCNRNATMPRPTRFLACLKTGALAASLALLAAPIAIPPAEACTRALYVGDSGLVITGRSMDWSEDMRSNLWVFPAGIERDGSAGPRSPHWRSKYGSVVVSGYDIGSVDGMNERGLVANALYLAETDYGKPDSGHPPLAISLWAQYVLDNFATVAEAVEALGSTLPDHRPAPARRQADLDPPFAIRPARRLGHSRIHRRQARDHAQQGL